MALEAYDQINENGGTYGAVAPAPLLGNVVLGARVYNRHPGDKGLCPEPPGPPNGPNQLGP